jgi:catechol 2,3-dioxygenase-like lactoylglutathione lyase family enzyme
VLHHLTLWVPDLARADESWSWLLERLGYERDQSATRIVLWRHPGGMAVVLEQSTDMVPGMLYSRLRPGLNHVAFRVESTAKLAEITGAATAFGWSIFPSERHAIAGGAEVVYMEDRDGFEVELVAALG